MRKGQEAARRDSTRSVSYSAGGEASWEACASELLQEKKAGGLKASARKAARLVDVENFKGVKRWLL
jgi:hypothetical protein